LGKWNRSELIFHSRLSLYFPVFKHKYILLLHAKRFLYHDSPDFVDYQDWIALTINRLYGLLCAKNLAVRGIANTKSLTARDQLY
jgi:hypothetical protein